MKRCQVSSPYCPMLECKLWRVWKLDEGLPLLPPPPPWQWFSSSDIRNSSRCDPLWKHGGGWERGKRGKRGEGVKGGKWVGGKKQSENDECLRTQLHFYDGFCPCIIFPCFLEVFVGYLKHEMSEKKTRFFYYWKQIITCFRLWALEWLPPSTLHQCHTIESTARLHPPKRRLASTWGGVSGAHKSSPYNQFFCRIFIF